MSRRSFSFRAVILSSIVGLALSLIPLATALAGGVSATFPWSDWSHADRCGRQPVGPGSWTL